MTKLNRQNAPEYKLISKLDVIHPKEIKMPNGVPVYLFNYGSDELVKIEIRRDSLHEIAPEIEKEPLVRAKLKIESKIIIFPLFNKFNGPVHITVNGIIPDAAHPDRTIGNVRVGSGIPFHPDISQEERPVKGLGKFFILSSEVSL